MILRERCIRAMAVNDDPILLGVAERYLDRLLAVLAEHADEWDDLAYEASRPDVPGMIGPHHYLAVLKESVR